jgi:hypothetical protein
MAAEQLRQASLYVAVEIRVRSNPIGIDSLMLDGIRSS